MASRRSSRPVLSMRCRNGAAVTLFEKESSCGGHTLTDTSSGYPVDLGFQVRLAQLGASAHSFSLLSLCRAHFAAPATRSGATPTTPCPPPTAGVQPHHLSAPGVLP